MTSPRAPEANRFEASSSSSSSWLGFGKEDSGRVFPTLANASKPLGLVHWVFITQVSRVVADRVRFQPVRAPAVRALSCLSWVGLAQLSSPGTPHGGK